MQRLTKKGTFINDPTCEMEHLQHHFNNQDVYLPFNHVRQPRYINYIARMV